MVFGQLVEGGIHHLALDGALDIRHFFGALVDEQHDQMHVREVVGDRVGDFFE